MKSCMYQMTSRALLTILSCSLLGFSHTAKAQDQAASGVRNLQVNMNALPQKKGDVSCIEAAKKTICRYIPVHELPANVREGILRVFYGGRQPGNPDEAYVRILNNSQIEFAHIDKTKIEEIIQVLPTIDTLDTYVDRRKVNIQIQILQLGEGADESSGFLIGAQYAGKNRKFTSEHDRVVTVPGASGVVNFNFAIGNLVNTLLNATLNNFNSRNDMKIVSDVDLQLTHGYQLSSSSPYSKSIFIQTTSVSSVEQREGITFQGQARFHENADSKIIIKDFSITVSQYEPNSAKKDGNTVGVVNYTSPVRDLELEVGCSTAIRVIQTSSKTVQKEKNLFLSSKDEVVDSKKVFLFVIKTLNDSKGSVPSANCSETGALPDLAVKK